MPGSIAEGVLPSLRARLRKVTVLAETDSTNSELSRLKPAEQHAHAILAERQTSGRGRRERKWHSPAGGNIYLSFAWRFSRGEYPFSTLPLVVAVAVANALKHIGLEGHGVKWPNDILVGGKKMAGHPGGTEDRREWPCDRDYRHRDQCSNAFDGSGRSARK